MKEKVKVVKKNKSKINNQVNKYQMLPEVQYIECKVNGKEGEEGGMERRRRKNGVMARVRTNYSQAQRWNKGSLTLA